MTTHSFGGHESRLSSHSIRERTDKDSQRILYNCAAPIVHTRLVTNAKEWRVKGPLELDTPIHPLHVIFTFAEAWSYSMLYKVCESENLEEIRYTPRSMKMSSDEQTFADICHSDSNLCHLCHSVADIHYLQRYH